MRALALHKFKIAMALNSGQEYSIDKTTVMNVYISRFYKYLHYISRFIFIEEIYD